jgi:hypothetical protein
MKEIEQTTIPVPEIESGNHLCQWCGDVAVAEITLEKERNRYKEKGGKRVKELAKRAITAFVCARHRDILLRNNPDAFISGSRTFADHTKKRQKLQPNWMKWGKRNDDSGKD